MRISTRAAVIGVVASFFIGGAALAGGDYGQRHQSEMADDAQDLFGVSRPVPASSTIDLTAEQAAAKPSTLLTVAKGLKVKVVTAGQAAPNLDQMVLWPKAAPTHLIACNEEGTAQAGVQKIELATGKATTIATGVDSCDPVRVTPWGTVIFGEESDTGAMYEMINPLSVEGATIDRTTGASSSPNIRRIDALGFLAFEGLGILPNGVTYYGDERSAGGGASGGAYYKFVPTTSWVAGSAPIASLDQSPYAGGTVYALRVGQGNNFGPGVSYGIGSWRSLTSNPGQVLAPLAVAAQATGYYRPEDIDLDAKAVAAGNARMCGANTGRDSARYGGEAICITDGPVAGTASGTSVPEVQLLVQGSTDLNMPDNVAYQPGRGNWILHEDGSTANNVVGSRNNDIWSCLDDGIDWDTMTDGCIRVATVNDLDAETTGGFFDPSGTHYYVSVQHNSSGFGTILDITGWR